MLTGVGSFNDLSSVNFVGGDIIVRNNPSLLTFGNFGQSAELTVQTLWIGNNALLETVASLKASVASALIIRLNPFLRVISEDVNTAPPLGPTFLSEIRIEENRDLESVSTIFNNEFDFAVTDNFYIRNNPSLVSIGNQALFAFNSIEIIGNGELRTIGEFTGVTDLTGDLIIQNNPKLTSTFQLNGLNSVGGDIVIDNNDALTIDSYLNVTDGMIYSGLYGFRSLQTANSLTFSNNDGIENLNDFSNLETLTTSLSITNNALLSDCCELTCVDVAGNPFDTYSNSAVTVSGNTGDCTDKVAMRTACASEPCVAAAAVIFPIDLISFTGSLADDHVALTWETATETDNSHFFVERSTNGFTFTAIGRVEGAGSSTEAIRYDYPDYDYPAGRIYYRLRQVDFDGTESVSETVTIISEEAVTGLQTYPNPVAAGTPVEIAMGKVWAMGQISVDVFTADGRRAFSLSHPAGDRITVPTTGLSTGLHLLRISNGARSETQRLLVR